MYKPAGWRSSATSPHSYSKKRRDARARARAITKIGWPVRSQRLVFFGTMKPSLKTKGVTASIPGLGFAELSAFRFLLLPLSASLLALLFLSSFLSFPFSFFFFTFDPTTTKSRGRNTSAGNESGGCRRSGVEVEKRKEKMRGVR